MATVDTQSADGFVLNQTMLRIKDPSRSIPFYEEVLGMTLIDRFDFPEMAFSLYFLGYVVGEIPTDPKARAKWLFEQPALLELTHNHGSEDDPDTSYHNGNEDPRGFGHIGFTCDDIYASVELLEKDGVAVQRKPGPFQDACELAFVRDPDEYWIELIQRKGFELSEPYSQP